MVFPAHDSRWPEDADRSISDAPNALVLNVASARVADSARLLRRGKGRALRWLPKRDPLEARMNVEASAGDQVDGDLETQQSLSSVSCHSRITRARVSALMESGVQQLGRVAREHCDDLGDYDECEFELGGEPVKIWKTRSATESTTASERSALESSSVTDVETAALRSTTRHEGSLEKWCVEKFASETLTAAVLSGTLEAGVAARLAEQEPTKEDVLRGERCIKEMNEIVRERGASWLVHPLGSQANGFALKGSDLDCTCLTWKTSRAQSSTNRQADQTHLLCMESWIISHPGFEVVGKVFGARVPILQLRFEDKLDVDLSSNNRMPLKNTKLLSAYSELDGKVRSLGLAVKLWAMAAKVTGANCGYLSKYSFTLMVIYFMQVDPQLRLPCIALGNIDKPSWQESTGAWSCDVSLPQLVARFFHFYTNIFSWQQEVVSVRLGRREHSRAQCFAQLPYRDLQRLHIEDPFELGRNLNCVLGLAEEETLRAALANALREILLGGAPSGLRAVASADGAAARRAEAGEDGLASASPPEAVAQNSAITSSSSVAARVRANREVGRSSRAKSDVQREPEDIRHLTDILLFPVSGYTAFAMWHGDLIRMVNILVIITLFWLFAWRPFFRRS